MIPSDEPKETQLNEISDQNVIGNPLNPRPQNPNDNPPPVSLVVLSDAVEAEDESNFISHDNTRDCSPGSKETHLMKSLDKLVLGLLIKKVVLFIERTCDVIQELEAILVLVPQHEDTKQRRLPDINDTCDAEYSSCKS